MTPSECNTNATRVYVIT